MNAFIRSLTLLIATAPFAFAQKEFGFDNRMASGQPYLTPEETVKRMKVPPEFDVKLFAGEPLVVNPIAFTIDEKGRIWVIESFEYPSRTPKGKKPRDRIVILEDTKGTGVCDKRTVFCEGKDFPETFDLASGIEVGSGGVYVGAAPYLWFIENKNDKPGKFEILLKGFGSQDTHEMLNTFQWGPDGWLYGLHGIYTESKIKTGDGPEQKMNAAVWRYHPAKKKFEVFAEGTSNPWGMDWRNTDGQFIACCCVIPHLFHIVPGGIYKRQAGASQNPYAYGYINEICDHTFHKESGWAHAGLISLDVPHMPERFRNSVIFGSIHGNSLKQNILKPNGSTYTASRGDDFLTCGDKNFRPINLRWGPNGDIYLIDWHDQNPCHQAAADSWDYEHGRVYRIQLKGAETKKAIDMAALGQVALAEKAFSADPWESRTALRMISQLSDEKRKIFQAVLAQGKFQYSRSILTQLGRFVNALEGVDPNRVANFVVPPVVAARQPAEMGMTLQLFAESEFATQITADGFAIIAEATPHIALRRDLASAALWLTDSFDTSALVHALLKRKEDAGDPLMSMLIWIAYEKHFAKLKDVADEMQWLRENAKENALVQQILPKIMRRLVADGKPERLLAGLDFIHAGSDALVKEEALSGLTTAFKNQSVNPPEQWKAIRDELLAMKDSKITAHVNALSVAFRDPEAAERAFKILNIDTSPVSERTEALRIIVQLKHPQAAATCISILRQGKEESLRIEAARLLVAFDNPKLGQEVIDTWASYPKAIHMELVTSLASRKEWAKALLVALKEKKIDRAAVSDSAITRIQAFKDAALDALIAEAWGRSRATPKELQKLIDDTRLDLGKGPGSFVRGKAVFEQQCAKCHKFEGKGSDVGPALDGAGRDIEYLLVNVLDPNRVIGAPYFVRQALLLDGQLIQGVLAEEDEKSITLKVENAVLKKIAKADLDAPVKVLEKSLMPEGLSAGMKPQDFRDLICYVMAHPFIQNAKVNGKSVTGSVTGLLPLPDEIGKPMIIETTFTLSDPIKTTLMVGSANAYEAFLDDKPVGGAAGTERSLKADSDRFDVTLAKGPHTLKLVVQSKWASKGVYLRFLDPERKISYQE